MKTAVRTVLIALLFLTILSAAIAETEALQTILTVVDQYGEPVEGVMLSICSGTMCVPGYTDANGQLTLNQLSDEVEIHIISIPEGYSCDEEKFYTLQDLTDAITVTKE